MSLDPEVPMMASTSKQFLPNQIVWARWSDKWYAAIIFDPSSLQLTDYQHVMWLGDGRVSQVKKSEIRDFCQGFLTCYPNMNRDNRFIRAVDLAIQLAIARSQATVTIDRIEWAKANLPRFMELTVSQSFYSWLHQHRYLIIKRRREKERKLQETEKKLHICTL